MRSFIAIAFTTALAITGAAANPKKYTPPKYTPEPPAYTPPTYPAPSCPYGTSRWCERPRAPKVCQKAWEQYEDDGDYTGEVTVKSWHNHYIKCSAYIYCDSHYEYGNQVYSHISGYDAKELFKGVAADGCPCGESPEGYGKCWVKVDVEQYKYYS